MRAVLSAILLISAVASAESQPGPLRTPGNQSPDHQQIRSNDALETIASQLSSIREETARIEQQRADRESDYWPPDWPNWFTFIVTFAAVIAAFKTLAKMERQTKATVDTAAAATTSADAAKRALIIQSGAQLKIGRPILWSFGVNREIHFPVENIGHVTATNIILTISQEWHKIDTDATRRIDQVTQTHTTRPHVVIEPGAEGQIVSMKITDAVRANLPLFSAANDLFIVQLRWSYQNGFGEQTAERVSRYRYLGETLGFETIGSHIEVKLEGTQPAESQRPEQERQPQPNG